MPHGSVELRRNDASGWNHRREKWQLPLLGKLETLADLNELCLCVK